MIRFGFFKRKSVMSRLWGDHIRPRPPWNRTAVWFTFYIVGLAVLFFYFAGLLQGQRDIQQADQRGEMVFVHASFGKCHQGQGYNCVVDGDTFLYRGQSIRIADINTPETYRPSCDREADLGAKATQRMLALLNEAPFTIEPYGNRTEDQYGRALRRVTRNGYSLGEILVSEGLAHRWTGRRLSWCA